MNFQLRLLVNTYTNTNTKSTQYCILVYRITYLILLVLSTDITINLNTSIDTRHFDRGNIAADLSSAPYIV